MRLNQLQFLLTLSREGSYQKAAQRLQVSQSTISMAIKNLEDELNCQLVQRGKDGIFFTEKGKLILEQVVDIDEDLRELSNLKNSFIDKMAGQFCIAGASHRYNLELVDLIIKLHKIYPRLQISLEDRNNLEIIRKVAQRKYPIGLLQLNSIDEIFYESEMEKNNLIFSFIKQGKMCFVAGVKHPLYGKKEVSLDELLKYSILTYRYEINDIFLNFLRQHGYKEQVVIMHDIYTSRALVEKSNQCITIIPESGVENDNVVYKQNLKILPVTDFECTYKIGWVYRNERYSRLEQDVIQLLKDNDVHTRGD